MNLFFWRRHKSTAVERIKSKLPPPKVMKAGAAVGSLVLAAALRYIDQRKSVSKSLG